MSASGTRSLSARGTRAIVLAILVGFYGFATLPALDRFPLVGRDEAQIAAPAYKWARDGVYGQDMYAGYYHSENYVYEFMPLHPVLLALTFRLFGLGVEQARLVSVLCGLVTVLLTFALGRRICGAGVGLLAAGVLCAARLSLEPRVSGTPLLDLARVVRYDVLVPVWVLASSLCFLWACRHDRALGYAASGLLGGLATLSHAYGAFVLAVFALTLLWEGGWGAVRRAPVYLVLGGWLLALAPWVLYALQDPASYYGQTQVDRAAGNLDVLHPGFYWRNLIREPLRYRELVRGQEGGPPLRLGLGFVILGVVAANARLWTHARGQRLTLPGRFMLLGAPVLAGLMALLLNHKRYSYVLLVLPFVALQAAFGISTAWRWAANRRWPLRGVLAAFVLAVLFEAVSGVKQNLATARSASSYDAFVRAVARNLPPGSRVLAVHIYWFGLARYPLRSLDLPFRLSNPDYYPPRPLSMDDALSTIAPDYLLADPLIERHVFHPLRPAEDAVLEGQKRDFTQAVQTHCPEVLATVGGPEAADYGPMRILRCDWRRRPAVPGP